MDTSFTLLVLLFTLWTSSASPAVNSSVTTRPKREPPVYRPIKPSYRPPPRRKPKPVYGAPRPVYGPPGKSKPVYGPPPAKYGPPPFHPPPPKYSPPPSFQPASTYGASPMVPPSTSYGVPMKYRPPPQKYRPPSQEYGPPVDVYERPSKVYGAPSPQYEAPPPRGYGPPPSGAYGAPPPPSRGPPSAAYGPPSGYYESQTTSYSHSSPSFVPEVYHSSYDVPKDFHSHSLTYDTSSASYGTPGAVNSYGVPVFQQQPVQYDDFGLHRNEQLLPNAQYSPSDPYSAVATNNYVQFEETTSGGVVKLAHDPTVSYGNGETTTKVPNHNYDGPGVQDDSLEMYIHERKKQLQKLKSFYKLQNIDNYDGDVEIQKSHSYDFYAGKSHDLNDKRIPHRGSLRSHHHHHHHHH